MSGWIGGPNGSVGDTVVVTTCHTNLIRQSYLTVARPTCVVGGISPASMAGDLNAASDPPPHVTEISCPLPPPHPIAGITGASNAGAPRRLRCLRPKYATSSSLTILSSARRCPTVAIAHVSQAPPPRARRERPHYKCLIILRAHETTQARFRIAANVPVSMVATER